MDRKLLEVVRKVAKVDRGLAKELLQAEMVTAAKTLIDYLMPSIVNFLKQEVKPQISKYVKDKATIEVKEDKDVGSVILSYDGNNSNDEFLGVSFIFTPNECSIIWLDPNDKKAKLYDKKKFSERTLAGEDVFNWFKKLYNYTPMK